MNLTQKKEKSQGQMEVTLEMVSQKGREFTRKIFKIHSPRIIIFCFIYLLDNNLLPQPQDERASTPRKETSRKEKVTGILRKVSKAYKEEAETATSHFNTVG